MKRKATFIYSFSKTMSYIGSLSHCVLCIGPQNNLCFFFQTLLMAPTHDLGFTYLFKLAVFRWIHKTISTKHENVDCLRDRHLFHILQSHNRVVIINDILSAMDCDVIHDLPCCMACVPYCRTWKYVPLLLLPLKYSFIQTAEM